MTYSSITDKELVIFLTRNDEDAFRELYLRYKDKLWHYCFSFLKSEEESNDIIQEVFIRLWEMRAYVNPNLSFSSFMYTIVRNRVLNYFRDMDVEVQVKKIISQKQPIEENSAEVELIFSEYQGILKEAIEYLPPQRKKIFNMSRFENMSHKEIAARLGISVNTVQEHISESLRFIKGYLSQHTDLTLSLLIFMLIN